MMEKKAIKKLNNLIIVGMFSFSGVMSHNACASASVNTNEVATANDVAIKKNTTPKSVAIKNAGVKNVAVVRPEYVSTNISPEKTHKKNPYAQGPFAEGKVIRKTESTLAEVGSESSDSGSESSSQSSDQSSVSASDNQMSDASLSTPSTDPSLPETRGESVRASKKMRAAGRSAAKSKPSDTTGGWKLSSAGGFSYDNPKDPRYWLKFSGVLRVDQTTFSGSYRDKRNDFPNSGFIRLAETYLDCGLGENWLSTLTVTWAHSTSNGRAAFGDTWIGYTGFAENNEVNIGRHSGNWFGLENSSSTAWNPFLERSLQAATFYPGDGLGILTDWWWNNGALTLIATAPDHGSRIGLDDERSSLFGRLHRSDRWKGIARATYAPVRTAGQVWHFGVSFAHKRFDASLGGLPLADTESSYRAWPGVRGRNIVQLVNTGPLVATYANQYNFEVAKQWCSLILEAEYTGVYVHRVSNPYGSVRFNGWSFQGRYILSGEIHEYDVRDGTFGKIDISSPYGAYEIAARYDFINLTNKDVLGGSQHNATIGFNWFINPQVRFSINYIRANIRPQRQINQPRHLDIIGLRLQARFK